MCRHINATTANGCNECFLESEIIKLKKTITSMSIKIRELKVMLAKLEGFIDAHTR